MRAVGKVLFCIALFHNLLIWGATFTVTNANDSGAGSFRQALTDANASAGNTIQFLTDATIDLLSPLPPIRQNPMTIDTFGNHVVLNGAASSGLFVWPISAPSL